MTTGTRVIGNSSNGFYASKSWSGGNDPTRHKVPQAYKVSMVTSMITDGIQFLPNGSSRSYRYGHSGSYLVPFSANDEIALLGELQAAITDNFNLAVSGAEFGESLATVTNSLTAIKTSLNRLFRGDPAGAMRALSRILGHADAKRIGRKLKTGDISGAWLALQYGWYPLIQDAYAAAKHIEKLSAGPRSLVYTVQKTVTGRSPINYGTSPTQYVVTAGGRRTVRYKVTLLEAVSQARALGLLDPATVVWEKVPFSFVLDWFIPIGNYLGALGFFRGLPLTYVKSDFQRINYFLDKKAFTPANPLLGSVVGGSLSQTDVYFTRSIGSSLSVPYPKFKNIGKALSLGHIHNAAALIHNILSSKIGSR